MLDGTHDSSNTFAGTPFYMSPEALGREGYSAKADVWSLGCIIYEACTLQQAFQGANLMAVMCAICDGPLPELPDTCETKLQDLVFKMLARDPAKRISASDVCKHPALTNYPRVTYKQLGYDTNSRRSKEQIFADIEKMRERSRKEKMRRKTKNGLSKRSVSSEGGIFGKRAQKESVEIPPWIKDHPDVFPDGRAPADSALSFAETISAISKDSKSTGGSKSSTGSRSSTSLDRMADFRSLSVDRGATAGSANSSGSATSSYATASDNSGGETIDENAAPKIAQRNISSGERKRLHRTQSTPGYIQCADSIDASTETSGSSGTPSFNAAQSMLDKAELDASGSMLDLETAKLAIAYSASRGSDSRRNSVMSDHVRDALEVIDRHKAGEGRTMSANEEEAFIRSAMDKARKVSNDSSSTQPVTANPVDPQSNSKRTRRPPTTSRFGRKTAATQKEDGSAEVQKKHLRRRSSHRREQPEDEFWHVPYFPTIYFTGRDKEMATIRQLLSKPLSQRGARCGISQHGGSGKTQLMLRYAWENRATYPGGIYLIEADNTNRLRQSLVDLAFALNVSSSCKPHAPPREIADVVFSALRDVTGEYLICVDNADDSEVMEMLGQVYLPPVRGLTGSNIIVTSRSADSRLWADLGIDSPMVLGMLPEADAAVCLYRCGRGKWRESHVEIIKEIKMQGSEEMDSLYALVGSGEEGLDGLPLAIEQAGAYILRTKRGFADYRRFYRRQMLKLLEKEKAAKTRDDDSDREQRSVATTWGINVQGLSDTVQRLLATIACFNPHRIPEELLVRLTYVFAQDTSEPVTEYDETQEDDVQFKFDEWVLEGLVSKYSIIAMSNTKNEPGAKILRRQRCFSLHRVMHMVILARENEAGLAEAGSRALSAIYLLLKPRTYRTVVDVDRAVRDSMVELSPHARSLILHLKLLPLSAESSRQLAVIQRAEAFLDQFHGRYPEAIGRYQQALSIFKKVYSETGDHDDIAETLYHLGNCLNSNGDLKAAALRCEHSLEMFERLRPDEDNRGTAQAFHRTGTVHSKLKDHTKALDRFEKSLEMNRRLHGAKSDNDEISATLYRIGNELENTKQTHKALE